MRAEERIQLHLGAELTTLEGQPGQYRALIAANGAEQWVDAGTLVVATGGVPATTSDYLYGHDPRVLTQRELEQQIAEGTLATVQSVVMIQCAGSREPGRPYCCRICCTQAIKNALKLKQLQPEGRNLYSLSSIATCAPTAFAKPTTRPPAMPASCSSATTWPTSPRAPAPGRGAPGAPRRTGHPPAFSSRPISSSSAPASMPEANSPWPSPWAWPPSRWLLPRATRQDDAPRPREGRASLWPAWPTAPTSWRRPSPRPRGPPCAPPPSWPRVALRAALFGLCQPAAVQLLRAVRGDLSL